ncbi:hypothetical protein EYC84_006383 [Monilinia fructicola]|uniref:Uncharacterized protein n=1 Tax=Monilinia fructicola TaxID=38448 RepID=A0A5M9K831_MONFR|nr:hypothetical protein EYC84_006383 [Monilinia fructicola]
MEYKFSRSESLNESKWLLEDLLVAVGVAEEKAREDKKTGCSFSLGLLQIDFNSAFYESFLAPRNIYLIVGIRV